MRRILIGSAIVFAILMTSVQLQHAIGCFAVSPRSKSAWQRTPIEINTETALIVWDAEHKVEHFVRKATFQTDANHFGFLVPTPTKPELAESKDAIFNSLARITAPPPPRFPRSHSRSGRRAPGAVARAAVTVLETKQVAGFDAAVLAATDSKALNEWLRKHDYESSDQLNDWLKPYIDQGWIITAFKIAKTSAANPTVGSTAVRMSFQTDRPFFPYREPRAKQEPAVADDVIARQTPEAQELIRMLVGRVTDQQKRLDALSRTRRSRALRVYFLAEHPFKGSLGESGDWDGQTLFSSQLSESNRDELLGLLEIKSFQAPPNLWLTEFLDRSNERKGDRDLFFTADETKSASDPAPRPAAPREPRSKATETTPRADQ